MFHGEETALTSTTLIAVTVQVKASTWKMTSGPGQSLFADTRRPLGRSRSPMYALNRSWSPPCPQAAFRSWLCEPQRTGADSGTGAGWDCELTSPSHHSRPRQAHDRRWQSNAC